ncbi:PDDEXK family nuclease [Paraburkholderia kirstenboschensis]|uniref:DUF1064 domain-containing protein n=1 Tax=Paraburkholderia kirstenboschensis TaxID=1245436 RepID=A0ABZ0ERM6_9BURK|nr:hypothetical protein [Paraburkholderia kirstenboschensis]WOD19818.1 hypothetical protein RW095_26785 [Paraburkholderia kirstenboschensis]
MNKNALRYPESAIAGGRFGTARIHGEVASAAARLESTAPTALDAPIAQLLGRAQTSVQRMQALGRKPRGEMNKTERAYSQLLAARKHIGEIDDFAFESVKLRLAGATLCFYTPDFCVWAGGRVQFHEVKGFWTDDARVKIKVAAASVPWARFIAVRLVKGEWIREDF